MAMISRYKPRLKKNFPLFFSFKTPYLFDGQSMGVRLVGLTHQGLFFDPSILDEKVKIFRKIRFLQENTDVFSGASGSQPNCMAIKPLFLGVKKRFPRSNCPCFGHQIFLTLFPSKNAFFLNSFCWCVNPTKFFDFFFRIF